MLSFFFPAPLERQGIAKHKNKTECQQHGAAKPIMVHACLGVHVLHIHCPRQKRDGGSALPLYIRINRQHTTLIGRNPPETILTGNGKLRNLPSFSVARPDLISRTPPPHPIFGPPSSVSPPFSIPLQKRWACRCDGLRCVSREICVVFRSFLLFCT